MAVTGPMTGASGRKKSQSQSQDGTGGDQKDVGKARRYQRRAVLRGRMKGFGRALRCLFLQVLQLKR